MKQNKKKGFTLVELLVVIAILSILASVSVVGYLSFTKKANQSKCETEALEIRTVMNGHLMDGSVLTSTSGYTAQLVSGKLELNLNSNNNVDEVIKELFPDLALLDKANSVEFAYDSANKLLSYTTNNFKAVITFDGADLVANPVQ